MNFNHIEEGDFVQFKYELPSLHGMTESREGIVTETDAHNASVKVKLPTRTVLYTLRPDEGDGEQVEKQTPDGTDLGSFGPLVSFEEV